MTTPDAPDQLLTRLAAILHTAEHPQLLYTLTQAATILGGIGESTLRNEHHAGRITFTKRGKSTYIHRDELISYAKHLPTE